jgi:hypothetical protein
MNAKSKNERIQLQKVSENQRWTRVPVPSNPPAVSGVLRIHRASTLVESVLRTCSSRCAQEQHRHTRPRNDWSVLVCLPLFRAATQGLLPFESCSFHPPDATNSNAPLHVFMYFRDSRGVCPFPAARCGPGFGLVYCWLRPILRRRLLGFTWAPPMPSTLAQSP